MIGNQLNILRVNLLPEELFDRQPEITEVVTDTLQGFYAEKWATRLGTMMAATEDHRVRSGDDFAWVNVTRAISNRIHDIETTLSDIGGGLTFARPVDSHGPADHLIAVPTGTRDTRVRLAEALSRRLDYVESVTWPGNNATEDEIIAWGSVFNSPAPASGLSVTPLPVRIDPFTNDPTLTGKVVAWFNDHLTDYVVQALINTVTDHIVTDIDVAFPSVVVRAAARAVIDNQITCSTGLIDVPTLSATDNPRLTVDRVGRIRLSGDDTVKPLNLLNERGPLPFIRHTASDDLIDKLSTLTLRKFHR